MLRVSRIADYGIVLLAHLAGDPSLRSHNARELADEAGLPLPVVSKVLKLLAHENILTSQRGTKGGYRLARSTADVSVAQVIGALEGPIGLVECTVGPGHCDRQSSCVVHSPWKKINQAILVALERVTLADLLAPPAEGFIDVMTGRPTSSEPNIQEGP